MTGHVLGNLWGATHVLSFERGGAMVESMVRLQGDSLFTVEEWTGHAPADWTLRGGVLRFGGRRFRGRAFLRPLPPARLSLDEVLAAIVRLGKADEAEVARELRRDPAEVAAKVKALRLLQLAPGVNGQPTANSGQLGKAN